TAKRSASHTRLHELWVGNFRQHDLARRDPLHSASRAKEWLKGTPASPGPKRVFRTVVSELARGLICRYKPVGHVGGHKRTMSIVDELARAYMAKLERQQHAQSTGLSALNRGTSVRTPHSSAGTQFQSTSGGRIHCEECGRLTNEQSVCAACRASPTRLWLQ